MKRNSNKGFSLVELIVVVLIMAIIAVVLAPQVTKWVQNSRESSDLQTFDSVQEFAQLALTDSNANQESASGIEITIDKSSCTIKGGSPIESFASKFSEYAGIPTMTPNASKTEYSTSSIKAKADGTNMYIKIKDGGIETARSGITNADLEVTSSSSPITTPGGSDPHVTETPTPEAKSVSISDASVEEGGTATITATIKGYSGSEPELEWVSKNAGVVTVTGTGKTVTLTAKGSKGATAVIEVSVKDEATVKGSCTVTIIEAGSYTLSLSAPNTTIENKEAVTITANVTPSSAENQVEWSIKGPDNNKASLSSNTGASTTLTAKAPGSVEVTAKIGEGAKEKTAKITITITAEAPAQRTIKHVLKKADNTEVQIDTETVNKSADKKYTSTKTFSYDNITRQTTDLSFTADQKDNELKVVWVAKSGWGISFGTGNSHTANGNKYDATIVINNQTYAVYDSEDTIKSVKHYGEDVNLTDETNKPDKTCTVYLRSKRNGEVTLTKYESSKSGGTWSWTKKSTTYLIYIP